MNTTRRSALLALAGLTLAGCDKPMPVEPRREPPAPKAGAALAGASRSRSRSAACAERGMNTVNEYKTMAAEVIVLNNTDFMFSGQIPPILRSIVVLNLSIDRDGALTRAVVQRSRNQKASLLALTAVRRVGDRFPKPQHLIHTGYQTLDFAETFLFNDDLRFQIRTLAGVQ